MGAKYALWVTLQLMAEIFSVVCRVLLLFEFVFGDAIRQGHDLKMLSMLSSPLFGKALKRLFELPLQAAGEVCFWQSTYPNGIGSQRNSGSLSLTGFVFTSCWRLFGHVLKF